MKSDNDMFKVWSYGPVSLSGLFHEVDKRAPDNHPKKIAAIKYNESIENTFKSAIKSLSQTIDKELIEDLSKTTFTNKFTIPLKWFSSNEK